MENKTIDFLSADKAKFKGEVTEAQIQAWKATNTKGIFRVIGGNDEHVGYFRNPYRGDVNASLSVQDNKKPLASIERFAELLWLGGSRAILEEDAVWLGIIPELRSKMNGLSARLENL